MDFRVGPLCGHGSREHGVWWVRLFGVGFALRSKRNAPMFSERYGYRKTHRLPFRFRIEFLRYVKIPAPRPTRPLWPKLVVEERWERGDKGTPYKDHTSTKV